MVWHVDKYKITFKLVISHWTNEMSFSIYYSPQNIATIKYLFMKNAYKTKMSTQSERKQTSVMCYTKHYDRPIGQRPEPLQKLRNNHIKDHHSRNSRESKIVQLIHKTTHHRRRSYTPQPPAIQNNKTPRPQ